MADWPLFGDGQRWVGGNAMGALTTIDGRLVNCGLSIYATAVELWSATALPIAASGLLLSVWNTATGAAVTAISIGYGTLPNERPIISNLMVQTVGDTGAGYDSVFLPVSIPALTQVTATGISTASSVTVRVSALAVGRGMAASAPGGIIETLPGSGASAWQGLTLAYGVGTAEGAQTTFGTTLRPWREMILAFGANADPTRTTIRYLINVYVNGVLYMEGIPVSTHTTSNDIRPKYLGPVPVAFPAGTSISATIRRHSTSTDGMMRMTIYGVS